MSRIEKYRKKIRGLVLPSQVPGYKASLPDRVRLEHVVKSLGVTPMLQFSYVSFAEQLLKVKNTHQRQTGVQEAIALANHWLSRGLDSDHLQAIGTALGFQSVVSPGPSLHEYYNTGDTGFANVNGLLQVAQSFTVGSSGPNEAHEITSVKLKMFRTGSPGMVFIGIKAVDGAGKPAGPDLSSGTIDGNSLTFVWPGLWYEISMSSFVLQPTVQYAIVVSAPGGDVANWIGLRVDGAAPTYPGGNLLWSNDGGGTWTHVVAWDVMFEVWGLSPWP